MSLLNSSLLCCLSVFFFTITGLSQEDGNGLEIKEKFKAFFQDNRSELRDSITYYEDLRQLTRLKYEIAKERYFENQYSDYFTNSLEHRRQTFYWQLQSTKWIFLMVIIIVFSGLFFAGIQFYHSIKKNNSKKKIYPEKQEEMSKTEMELSLKGVKINSSVIGLIILVISVAFFYLYILYVYPINQINIDNSNFSSNEIKNGLGKK